MYYHDYDDDYDYDYSSSCSSTTIITTMDTSSNIAMIGIVLTPEPARRGPRRRSVWRAPPGTAAPMSWVLH